MGTRGRAIVGVDVDELLVVMNKALADEWLAYYQYWVASKIVAGPMRENVIAELVEHANDELRHAELLADRIAQLGGTPLLEPRAWYDHTNCGYEPPTDPYVRVVIEQNIKAEQCAIDVYQKLSDMVYDKDRTTYNIAQSILEDEIEHEDDLEALLEDMDLMKQRG
ncbi:MAG: ferritin [Candidatus Coatesbacteria bacterium]|nr:ferritin [Candidatus Coatesbacteria bacterium]